MNLLLVVLAASQISSTQPEAPPREPPKWEVFMGFQGGIRPDTLGGGGGALLGVNRQLLSWLRAELSALHGPHHVGGALLLREVESVRITVARY